ncbi:hypothetical protein BC941DRAFT_352979 [Chlamydoabsidia padenii]|nr:hypothetical protein BC941DRAFT_352979 [Chlamydoabsidia padenii]
MSLVDVISDDRSLKAHQVVFTVKSMKNLMTSQEIEIKEITTVLGLSSDQASILLRQYKWNKDKLYEGYMGATEIIQQQQSSGLSPYLTLNSNQHIFDPTSKLDKQPLMCTICCDDDPGMKTISAACGHLFCIGCYQDYLCHKINDDGETLLIECPQYECKAMVDDTTIQRVVNETTMNRYRRLQIYAFVDNNSYLRWCPAPGCDYAVECKVPARSLDSIVPTVQCACETIFCFGCGLSDHRPVPCALVHQWSTTSSVFTQTMRWLLENTKECPKCGVSIQKNGGCDFMTCRKCHHGFCWVCSDSHHLGKCYRVNKDMDEVKKKTLVQQKRHLHIYSQFEHYENTTKSHQDLYKKTEKKMKTIQQTTNFSWIDVQFLLKAAATLMECETTLKWSYVFDFFLAESNELFLFRDNQKDLDLATKQLSELLNNDDDDNDIVVDEWRHVIVDKTAYVKKRRETLLEDTAKRLLDGSWTFDTTHK